MAALEARAKGEGSNAHTCGNPKLSVCRNQSPLYPGAGSHQNLKIPSQLYFQEPSLLPERERIAEIYDMNEVIAAECNLYCLPHLASAQTLGKRKKGKSLGRRARDQPWLRRVFTRSTHKQIKSYQVGWRGLRRQIHSRSWKLPTTEVSLTKVISLREHEFFSSL